MDLHQLAAENNEAGLRRALSDEPGAVDIYAPRSELEGVINRHGLKGTPLHTAVVSGSVECVRLLLEQGADPGKCVIQSERGDELIAYADAAWLALQTGDERIISLLEKV